MDFDLCSVPAALLNVPLHQLNYTEVLRRRLDMRADTHMKVSPRAAVT